MVLVLELIVMLSLTSLLIPVSLKVLCNKISFLLELYPRVVKGAMQIKASLRTLLTNHS